MSRLWTVLLWAPAMAAQVIPDQYIVQLTSPPASSVRRQAGRTAALARRAAIRAEQDEAAYALKLGGAEVLDSVTTVANALIVRAADADGLAGAPGVARVYPVREYQALLDRAVGIHKAVDAWQSLGGAENAGAGVKIAILDTGLDFSHPAFQDPSLPVPDGYPKGDPAYTSNKVIVARSYGTGSDPHDLYGHGTAVAMAAAGAPAAAPLAMLSGMAPKAYLGIYKITTGSTGSASNATILKAIDDAIEDGMDVINLSFGSLLATRPEDDIVDQAVEVAAASGVIFVAANGNDGPAPNTVSTPASAVSAIAVGASLNDRIFASRVELDGAGPYAGVPAADFAGGDAIAGTLADVSRLDSTGLACNDLPGHSLDGQIAFILRGSCTFKIKLDNARAAGATAALLYTHALDPEITGLGWTSGGAALPAEMVSYADGLDIRARLAGDAMLTATLSFSTEPMSVDPNRIAVFSARGPNADGGIKPDLVAVGSSVYTAAEQTFRSGSIYSPSGFTTLQGTSFSAPMVAGAAALLKQARPGLTVRQYRSLLINSASTFTYASGDLAPVEWSGAGLLDAAAAIAGTVSAYPSSLSFGTGGSTAELWRDFEIANLGNAGDWFDISVAASGSGPAPEISETGVWLEAGATKMLTLHFLGADLTPGAYQGSVRIQPSGSAVPARVPYWYGVGSDVPAYLTVLESSASGAANRILLRAMYFRVTDANGIPITSVEPEVTAISGGGSVVAVRLVDSLVPGAFAADVVLGRAPGTNTFEINAGGNLIKTVQISGSRYAP